MTSEPVGGLARPTPEEVQDDITRVAEAYVKGEAGEAERWDCLRRVAAGDPKVLAKATRLFEDLEPAAQVARERRAELLRIVGPGPMPIPKAGPSGGGLFISPEVQPGIAQEDIAPEVAEPEVEPPKAKLPAIPEVLSPRRPAPPPLVINSSSPMKTARLFVGHLYYSEHGVQTLLHWRGAYWHWNGVYWEELDRTSIRAQVYDFLSRCVVKTSRHDALFDPDQAEVNRVIDALNAMIHVSPKLDAPRWMAEDEVPDIENLRELVATEEVLIDLPTRATYSHTPKFFNLTSLGFRYDPEARAPRFEQFLEELWPGDAGHSSACWSCSASA